MAKLKNNPVEEKNVTVNEGEAHVDNNTPSMSDMMKMFQQMQETITSLQTQLDEAKKEKEAVVNNLATEIIPEPVAEDIHDTTVELLSKMVNRKSEREVTLVHNRELIGGLSTSIHLSNLTIDFHTLGEQRMLSWQQFEECVSKYHNWFEKEIILLGADCADLAERYNVPYVKREGVGTITKKDLQTIYSKSETELEALVNSLSAEDKRFVCSYWLGKCYEKDAKFLQRSKIELLNRLTGQHIFDNLLTQMNYDSVNK